MPVVWPPERSFGILDGGRRGARLVVGVESGWSRRELSRIAGVSLLHGRAHLPSDGGLAPRRIDRVTGLTDVESAFGYGDSILVGKLVRLRGLREDDLLTLARWEMDPGRMATSSNWVVPPSETAAKERVAKWCANDKDDLGFAIETVDDPPVLVGSIGLWGARPKDRCATIGISLGREHTGHGYGTDAMRVIVDYAFREMGLHRIQLQVAPFNQAGIRAYEKAGFVEEGRHRASVWHDGQWYDEVLMSVLDQEWAARRPGS